MRVYLQKTHKGGYSITPVGRRPSIILSADDIAHLIEELTFLTKQRGPYAILITIEEKVNNE